MKHRHTFFIPPSEEPPSPETAFELVQGKKGQPATLQIRHLQAAREWKITIGAQDIENSVFPVI
jgi:hypothetical protein